MAEAYYSRETRNELTESEMAVAQQLMQLSDEDNDTYNINGKRSRSSDDEVDQSLSDITSAIIQKIFGEDEIFRPKKQRRYRSLLNIYMTTRPIQAANGKKVRA